MKLEKKDIICIVLLILCAFLMTLEFGGNYDTFYEWLSGEANGFSKVSMPDDSLFMVLAWIYLISLVGTVFFRIIKKWDYAKFTAYISSGAISVFNLFGLYGTTLSDHGPFCIGMPLLLIITLAISFLSVSKRKKAEGNDENNL